jgi:(p)ppGpp synthase/HD superfamily hydrolase
MRLSARFNTALEFAAQTHATQVRKGSGLPYVEHLLGVCSIALSYGADEDEAIAALLHDAVEDQGGPAMREKIRQRFGERVAEIVDGCTDTDETPKPPWRARKEAYIAHLALASSSVLLVSSSDKLHNARSILRDYRAEGDAVWTRFTGRKSGTLWYYRALTNAYRAINPTPLVEELDRTVTDLERLAEETREEGLETKVASRQEVLRLRPG